MRRRPSARRAAHRCAAAVLAARLAALPLACYRPAPDDPGRLGRDGWLLYLEKPGEYLTAVRNKDSFQVRARNAGTFEVIVTPRTLAFPLPPGAQRLEGEDRHAIFAQELVYTLPPGRTFQDVYDWYRAWFAFGRTPPSAAPARR
ncbi:MAG: hypothetical protein HZA54_18810 [Planctomycetes bacterium]|nr:hypothetical protein [Planctomycetota bacterium]